MLKSLFRRRPLIEELEPRILYSADLAPFALDSLSPAPEQRVIQSDGEFSSVAATVRNELVIVDAGVQDYETLLADILGQAGSDRHFSVVILDADRDGISQISDVLKQYGDLDAVHLITHGGPGSLQLGSTTLDLASLDNRAEEITAWSQAFHGEGDWLIYGCDVASGAEGEAFVRQLGALTQTDVAGSDDLTGSVSLSGDWDLEFRNGTIESNVILDQQNAGAWQGVLVKPVLLDTANPLVMTPIQQITVPPPVPSGPLGDLVSSLIDTVDGSGRDNFVDSDGPGIGIAINGANLNGGKLFYSPDNGANWTEINAGTLSNSNVFLLPADVTTRIYFQPAQNYTGYISNLLSVNAWDQSAGSPYNYDDPGIIGSGAFSSGQKNIAGQVTASGTNAAPTATNQGVAELYTLNTTLDLTDIVVSDTDSGEVSVTLTLSDAGAGALTTGTSGAITSSFIAGEWRAKGILLDVNALLASVSFVPTTGYVSDFSIAVSISDGLASPVTGVKLMSVNNAAPVATTTGTALNYTENDPATAVDAGLVVSDTVPGTLTGATVSLTGNYANGQDLLAFTNQLGISGSWDVDTGVLTLTGTATVANYETALRSVTYINTSNSPSTLARTVSFVVNDGTSPSVAATRTVTVAAENDPPVITSGSGGTASVSINENMTEATTVTATDVDLPAQTLSYSIVPVGSGGAADAAKFTISAAGVLSFIAPPDYEIQTDAGLNNIYDVTVQVSDGNGGTATQVISVTVNDLGGPLTVDTTADTVDGNTTSIEALLASRGTDGLISLREAILATNATAGADVINLPSGTFTLTLTGNDATALLGDLDITDALTLRGTGSASTIIDATGLGDRLLEIFGVVVTVEDLTLRGGNAGSGGALYVDAGSTVNFNRVRIDNNTGASGGAIYNFNSTLTLTDSTLSGNQSTGFGGAIYNDRGTLTLTRSTVSGNAAASDGGGLYSFGNGATLTLLNTTVSGNTAGSDGGGISSNKPVTLTSSTIAYNTAATTGGGLHIVNPGSATLLNTIVANNTSSNTTLSGNSNSAVTSLGGNIDSGNTLGLAQPGDQINTDPLLGVLQDNGGFTFTHALLAGSPAINLGIAGGPATDQRGVTRDATPDIGAYEYVYTGNVAPAISMSATPLNFTEGDLPVLVDAGASINDPDSANFDGGSLTVQFSSGGTADDRLSLRDEGMGAGQIGITGATLYYGGVMIGSFSGGTDGATPLVVLFNASADLASVQATLRNVNFNNASQMPSATSRNVTVQLTDGDGGVSNIASRVIAVTAVNDPPVNTVPGAQTTAKNTTLVFSSANGNALSIADVDADSATVETTLTMTGGVLNAAAGTTGVAVTGSGTASVVLSGTLTQINTLLAGNLGGSLSYTPTAGFTGSASLQMVTNDLGSSGSGGAQTDTDVISIAVTDASLWLSTDGSATSSAGSGNLSWADGQVVNFGNPNLVLGTATTGTFSIAVKLAQLADDGGIDIKGLHYVSQDTIVGTTTPITLLAGDVLFSVDANETFGGINVTKQDIVFFRPTTPGDFSSGSFQIVLRNPGGTGNDVRDFALVEAATTVGDTALQKGDFLLLLSSGSYDKDVWLFRATTTGTTTSGAALVELVNGDTAGLNLGAQLRGIELITQTISIGGKTLSPGQLLLSLNGNALIGGLSVQEGDVAILTLLTSGSLSTGAASMLMRAADVGLTGGGETLDALALVQRASAAPIITVDASVLAYIENDLPSLIAPAATVTDADSSNFGGGSLSVYLSSNGTVNDRLAIRNEGTAATQIGISGSDVTYSGVIIGSFSGGEDGTTPLVISLNANATLAATQALLRNITYANVSDDPSTLPRTASVVLTDGSGGVSSTVSRTISVTATNDAPTITGVTASTAINDTGTATPFSGVVIGDVDSPAQTQTVSITLDLAAKGSLSNLGGGSYSAGVYSFSGTAAAATTAVQGLVFTPTANRVTPGSTETTTFTISVNDGVAPAVTDSATTVVTTSVNDAPVAVVDTATAVEAGGVANGTAGTDPSGNVLTNDTDVDNGDTKTVTAVSFGAAPGSVGSSLAGAYGTLTLNADGSYSYAVNNSNAAVQALRTSSDTLTEVFDYSMQDATGASSSSTLTITITGSNDAPVTGADTASAVEAGGVANGTAGTNPTGNVLTNDTDVDSSDTKTVTAVSFGVTPGVVGLGLVGTYGTLTLNADGSYSYVVDNNNAAVQALRSSDTLTEVFDYTMQDATGAPSSSTITITITGSNDDPVAVADTASAVEAGGVANGTAGTDPSGNVLSNDTDVDSSDTKTVTAVSFGATPGVVGLGLAGAYGTLTLNADGSYSYVVDNNNAAVQALRSSDTLTETFNYALQDMAGALGSSTLTITITGSNDAPVITSSGTQVVVEASPATVSTTASDVESDTLAFSITGGADAAWFTIDPSSGLLSLTFAPDYGTPKDANLDNLYEVIVTVNDGNGGTHTLTVQLLVADKIEPAPVLPEPPAPPLPPAPEAAPDKEADAEETQSIAAPIAPNEGIPKAAITTVASDASVTVIYQSATTATPAQMMVGDVQVNRNSAATSFTLVTLNQMLGGLGSDARALQMLQNSLDNGNFLQQLNQLQDTIRQQLNLDKNVVASTLAVSTGLSVGYVLWLVRGGVLLSSLLTSLPAWRLIDPLPILGHLAGKTANDDEDDSLEGMLKKSNEKIEPAPSDANEVTP